MAEKNSFVVYSQWATIIANLPDEQAAILSKAICCKHLGIEYEITDPTIKAVFISIEQKLDADNENYKKTCEARAKSGRKGGSASSAEKVDGAEERDDSNSDEEASKSKQNEAKASKSSFCLANEAKASKSKQNGGDNEYEYEYENENENENESPTGTKEKSVARDARTPAHENAAAPSRGKEPKEPKEPKHKHGEYGHVRLTDSEFVRLKAKHGEAETEAAIRAVDEYVETSGKKPYKNYALALEKWGYRAAREQLQREQADWQSVPAVARSGSTGGRAAPGGFDANDYLLERIANAERSVSSG